jgi:hypothetical protein
MSAPVVLTAEVLAANLDDPVWRLSNLYKIITKGDSDDDEGLVVPFRPNRAQRRLLAWLWHRNIILKARQLGFTTLIAILWLDTALFSKEPIRCGIIAQDKDTAEEIFRDKVRFAYDQLPEVLRERMPLKSATTKQLVWAHNGSSIKVATSVRGGTFHRLHVSEFGKICAKTPDKAKEVVTGSIPAVPKSGVLVIESTAEGQDGPFYTMTERARAAHEQRKVLTQKDYAFHFFAWWEAPEYVLPEDADVILTEVHHDYFNRLEGEIGRSISIGRRKWYVATMEADFGGDAPLMWQEYPSTPKEAFQVSTDGCYYAAQLSLARKQGRVLTSIPRAAVPVNTFWDIGRGDMTTIWLHQRVGLENRFIGYYEASGEDLDHFAGWLQKQGLTFGRHYLPHDANARRIGMNADTSRTIKEMLETLMPGQYFEIVPVVSNITAGIQATRNVFASCYFDETACAQGLKRLAGYRKEWDKTRGCWRATPLHDDNSHASDAFRQFGQEADSGNQFPNGAGSAQGFRSSKPARRRASGMTA